MENVEEKELTPKQWEKVFWKEYYKVCLTCVHNCKQSSKIISLRCKNFKEIN